VVLVFKSNERAERKQKIKRWLQSALYLRQEVDLKHKMLDELTMVENSVNEIGDNAVVSKHLCELRNSLLKDVSSLLVLKNRIKCAVDKLEDPRLRIIYEAKYINNQTWEEIAELMFFSVIHVRRLAESGYSLLADSIFSEAT